MSKRPAIDLAALTSEAAAPMPEAAQRTARPAPTPPDQPAAPTVKTARPTKGEATRTANLQGLAFKVPAAFRKRFRQRAADADLKLNELLFAALDAWEEKHHRKR
jgi:hypothetical protein